MKLLCVLADALDWFLWAERYRNNMPFITWVAQKGIVGAVECEVYVTPPACASFYTGLSAYQHGIWEFWDKQRNRLLDLTDFPPIHLHRAFVWEDVKELGLTVGLYELPLVQAHVFQNGWVVSGQWQPRGAYPSELDAVRCDYEVPLEIYTFSTMPTSLASVRKKCSGIHRHDIRRLWSHVQTLSHLWQSFPVDVCFAYINTADQEGHHCFCFSDLMQDTYHQMDRAIQRSFEESGAENLLIVSDHGIDTHSKPDPAKRVYVEGVVFERSGQPDGNFTLLSGSHSPNAGFWALGRELIMVLKGRETVAMTEWRQLVVTALAIPWLKQGSQLQAYINKGKSWEARLQK